jgi:PAS domain S-box-containing protein
MHTLARIAVVSVLLAFAGWTPLRAARMPAAAPGLVEAGAPAFDVISPEALGMTRPPTDLHLLSDGRLLAFNDTEISIGDGRHWDIVRRAPGEPEVTTVSVNVTPSDEIYASVPGGFARIEFGDDGRWRFQRVADLPGTGSGTQPLMIEAVDLKGRWLWHSGSGPLIGWNPGQTPRTLALLQGVDCIFEAFGQTYVSSGSDGSLVAVGSDRADPVIPATATTANYSITCCVPYDEANVLVGTGMGGLRLFDGTSLKPFTTGAPLAGGRPIRDLCAIEPGLIAVAVDTVGLVFIDRAGRTLQMLDRTLDRRLARVRRVLYADGTVWVLLQEGIARVQFPSGFSSFESMLPTGLGHVAPQRHEGRLWLLADGLAQRGVYDQDGRLLGFENDSPPGEFVHTLSTLLGPLAATNEEGIHVYEDGKWRTVLQGIANSRLEVPSRDGRRWFYSACSEYGWVWWDGDVLRAERFPEPRMAHVYSTVMDARGDIWIELGTAQAAHVRLHDDRPQVRILGPEHGVPEGWVQIFAVDGLVRFNVAHRILRFDEPTQRMVEDTALLARFPELRNSDFRPAVDAAGRLWMATAGTVRVFDPLGLDLTSTIERMPPGLMPINFTAEEGGVVWMHQKSRFVRFDPAVPRAREAALRAIISRVTLNRTGRTLFSVGSSLPDLDYANNSIEVRLSAPGNPLGQTTGFEVRLEGMNTTPAWTAAGSAGIAVFNNLKEGDYLLRARPVAGASLGAETSLAFTVLPPWYRTLYAYAGYGLAALATVFGTAWGLSYLERREKLRLERVVAQRTQELRASREQLKRAVESGSIGLWELDASAAELEWNEQCNQIYGTPAGTHRIALSRFAALIDASDRDATMQALHAAQADRSSLRIEHRITAPNGGVRWVVIVGRTILDAAGATLPLRGAMLDVTERREAEEAVRLLNATLERRVEDRTAALEAANRELESFSYSVSHDLRAPLRGIDGWSLALVEDYGAVLDETGRGYLQRVRAETHRLGLLIDDLLKLSRTTRAELRPETIDLSALVTDTAQRVAATRPDSHVQFACQPGLTADADRGLLEAVLFNLLDNAWKFSAKASAPRVEFGLAATPRGPAFFVRDNGAGFDMRHARNLFGVFQRMHAQEEFPGTGIGLATVRRIIQRHGGAIWAESEPGKGATFFFTLPASLTEPKP